MVSAECHCCKGHDSCCICWLHHDFNSVPSVNGQTLSEWFGKAPKNSGTKSWKFFKERYVHDVLVAPVLESLPDEGKASVGHGLGEHIVYGRCHRSMKKNESPHSLNLKVLSFEGRAQVSTAHCSCIAGCGGICNHIFALLYQMVDYFSDDLQQIPIDVSKTSSPQEWHIPRQESVESLPVMGTHFAKPETERMKLGERKKAPVCKLYDPRSAMMKCVASQIGVTDEASYLRDLDDAPPFSYLLSDQEQTMTVDTPLGTVPLGSCLSYQLLDHGRPKVKLFFSGDRSTVQQPHECKGFPDLPIAMQRNVSFLDIDDSLRDKLQISLCEAISLEKRTVQQSQCVEWREQRKLRLTASNFGKVNKRVKEPTESFFKAVFCCRNLGSIRSVSHGQANEKTARNVYAKECAKQIKNFRVFESGLLVNPDMPHLGATPDGKVYDPSMEECFGLLEIKCPLVQKELSLEEAVSSKGFYLKKGHTNMYSLMKNHPHGYYDQVQGQLAISVLSWCDFVVYLSDSHEMAVIRILFDEEYWNSLLSKLNTFYVKSLPFIRSLST